MNSIQIPRSINLNAVVAGTQKQLLGSQSVLDGRKVKAIIASAGPAKTSNGVAVCPTQNVYLQLVSAKNEVIHDGIPLFLLNPVNNGGMPLQLDSAAIDWTKSSLIFGDLAEAVANKGREIPLVVIYE